MSTSPYSPEELDEITRRLHSMKYRSAWASTVLAWPLLPHIVLGALVCLGIGGCYLVNQQQEAREQRLEQSADRSHFVFINAGGGIICRGNSDTGTLEWCLPVNPRLATTLSAGSIGWHEVSESWESNSSDSNSLQAK